MTVSAEFKREVHKLQRAAELKGRLDELQALSNYLPDLDPAQVRISIRLSQINSEVRDLEAVAAEFSDD